MCYYRQITEQTCKTEDRFGVGKMNKGYFTLALGGLSVKQEEDIIS